MTSQAPLRTPACAGSHAPGEPERGTWPAPGTGRPCSDATLDGLWLSLRACDDATAVFDVTREIAQGLDEAGVALEASTRHLASCIGGDDDEQLAGVLLSQRKGVQRVRELALDLLEATSGPSGGEPLRLVDLGAAVTAALALVGTRATGAIRRLSLPSGLPRIRARAPEIVRAVVGVLDQSVRATGGRGPIDLEAFADSSSVCVRVSDGARSCSRLERILELSFVARAIGRGGGSLSVEDGDTAGTLVLMSWRRGDVP